jgi:hypothetical protein
MSKLIFIAKLGSNNNIEVELVFCLQVIAPYVCMSNMTALECLTEGRFVTEGINATLYALSNGT